MHESNTQPAYVLGVPIDAVTMEEAVARCEEAIERSVPLVVGCVNAAKLVAMRANPDLHEAIIRSDLILADGMAIVWASRLLGQGLPERVGGIDLFLALLKEGSRQQRSVYLLGAEQQVVERVVERIGTEYPGLTVAGFRNGYFSEEELAGILEQVRNSGADMLFLAMSPPKKELFLGRWGWELGVSVAHGVGGSFDIFAGKVARAPLWMQRTGLEWLFRVFQEPGRLWKRYLVTNTKFASLVLQELLRRRISP